MPRKDDDGRVDRWAEWSPGAGGAAPEEVQDQWQVGPGQKAVPKFLYDVAHADELPPSLPPPGSVARAAIGCVAEALGLAVHRLLDDSLRFLGIVPNALITGGTKIVADDVAQGFIAQTARLAEEVVRAELQRHRDAIAYHQGRIDLLAQLPGQAPDQKRRK